MKAFVWENVGGVTSFYHDTGGVLVVAANLERAKNLIPCHGYRDDEEELALATPDYTIEVAGTDLEELVVVFPDHGCC